MLARLESPECLEAPPVSQCDITCPVGCSRMVQCWWCSNMLLQCHGTAVIYIVLSAALLDCCRDVVLNLYGVEVLNLYSDMVLQCCGVAVLQCYSTAISFSCFLFYLLDILFIIHRVVGSSHRRLTETLMHLTRSLEIPSPKTRIRMVWKYILIIFSGCS